MSPTAQLITDLINQNIRTYVPDYALNLNLNRVLLLIVQFIDSGGAVVASSNVLPITSANFADATNCPIPSFANQNIAIYWEEGGRFIEQDKSEWTPLAGGGFTITIDQFDSTTENYHFYVFKTP